MSDDEMTAKCAGSEDHHSSCATFHVRPRECDCRPVATREQQPGNLGESGDRRLQSIQAKSGSIPDGPAPTVPFIDYKLARDALLYWRYECSGAEPSLSVFNRMVDDALMQNHPRNWSKPIPLSEAIKNDPLVAQAWEDLKSGKASFS